MRNISLTPREAVHDQRHPQQGDLLEVMYSHTGGTGRWLGLSASKTQGKTGTDRRSNTSLSEVVMLDSDGSLVVHNTESGVPSWCGPDLGPGSSKDGLHGGWKTLPPWYRNPLTSMITPHPMSLIPRQHHASLVACMPQVPLFLNNVWYREGCCCSSSGSRRMPFHWTFPGDGSLATEDPSLWALGTEGCSLRPGTGPPLTTPGWAWLASSHSTSVQPILWTPKIGCIPTLMSSTEAFACRRELPGHLERPDLMLSATCLSMFDFEHPEMHLL